MSCVDSGPLEDGAVSASRRCPLITDFRCRSDCAIGPPFRPSASWVRRFHMSPSATLCWSRREAESFSQRLSRWAAHHPTSRLHKGKVGRQVAVKLPSVAHRRDIMYCPWTSGIWERSCGVVRCTWLGAHAAWKLEFPPQPPGSSCLGRAPSSTSGRQGSRWSPTGDGDIGQGCFEYGRR